VFAAPEVEYVPGCSESESRQTSVQGVQIGKCQSCLGSVWESRALNAFEVDASETTNGWRMTLRPSLRIAIV
jgi:hypothetical protein